MIFGKNKYLFNKRARFLGFASQKIKARESRCMKYFTALTDRSSGAGLTNDVYIKKEPMAEHFYVTALGVGLGLGS